MITAIAPFECKYIVVLSNHGADVIDTNEMDCDDVPLSASTDDREMALEIMKAWNIAIPYLNNDVSIIVV